MARAPVLNPPASTLLALYQTMVMARAIERRLWVLERLDNLPQSIRVSGLEAVQVAAAAALRPGRDWVVSGPLDLALCLAMGMSPLDVMLAIFEKASPYASSASRVVNTPAMGGRHVAQAAGIAYASQASGRDEVTLVCTGERGIYTGDWHEGLNFAGAHGLPLICLVEEIAGGSRTIARHL
ncbi:MAG: hypothetical protein E6J40_14560, partial [Chloroflexi bacterium]